VFIEKISERLNSIDDLITSMMENKNSDASLEVVFIISCHWHSLNIKNGI
tara:strand:- start:540 stop:689 length:150 start_codon:yes stop_codon:yes gene_type:complete